jgi:hypothetical protein
VLAKSCVPHRPRRERLGISNRRSPRAGSLTQIWHRQTLSLKPLYEQIWDDGLKSAVLNTDETGWHINGVLVWLWCFDFWIVSFSLYNQRLAHGVCCIRLGNRPGIFMTQTTNILTVLNSDSPSLRVQWRRGVSQGAARGGGACIRFRSSPSPPPHHAASQETSAASRYSLAAASN